jgi:hypothetical protein
LDGSVFPQPGVHVGQPQHGRFSETAAEEIAHAQVNAVAGYLRGQCEVDAAGFPFLNQTIRQREGCLRLARAHGRLDQHNPG